MSRPSTAATAPVTPTFALKWGTLGSAPGQMSLPLDAATDAAGDVYVADAANSRIQKFDRLGNFVLQWGGFGSGPGQFNWPCAVAVDRSGNVFVLEQIGSRVQKFTGSGVYLGQWGGTGSADGQFADPLDLATDPAGNVYVVDASNVRVQKFSNTGTFLLKWGVPGTADGQFSQPSQIATDLEGRVYVTDGGPTNTGRVQRFDGSGVFQTSWELGTSCTGIATDRFGHVYVSLWDLRAVRKSTDSGTFLAQWGSFGREDGQFQRPTGLTIDAAGDVYVTDFGAFRVQKFSGAGAAVTDGSGGHLLKWGAVGSGPGQMNGPWGVGTDAAGDVYVCDTNNDRIQRYSSTGAFLSQWGLLDSGNGQFNGPRSVCVDGPGGVYVVDGNNNRIQKFTSSGGYITQWGALGTGNGQFDSPAGIAVDAANNVYVADYSNHRIQKFTSAGVFVTQWGGFGVGDGQLNGPYGIAVDAAGLVYVVEQGNARVQKFTSTGEFVAKWSSAGTAAGPLSVPAGIAVDRSGSVFVVDYGNHRIVRFTSAGALLSWWGMQGQGNSQLNAPIGAATDAAGNLYVADTNNSRIQKFAIPASVALVSDVGNDQGRQTQIRFMRSSADAPGAGVTITGYEVYRRNDPLPAATPAQPSALNMAQPATTALAGWTYLTTVPAHGESEYNVVVPTLVDATSASVEVSAFMVRASTVDPFTFYDSGTGLGFSVDDLAPPTPTPFLAAYASSATSLHWGPSPAADFLTFRLYRGTSPDFAIGDDSFLAAISDTGYVDMGVAGRYYKLTAVDRNGNESPFALVGPGLTTDVEPREGFALALRFAGTNPSPDGRVALEFELPRAGAVRLELLDVSGRRVASHAAQSVDVGRHAIDLAAGRALPAGLYLARLSFGHERRSLRVAIVR